MSEQHPRWRRAVPVATLALLTTAGLVGAASAAADPLGPSGAAKGAPAAAPPRVSDAGCTLTPSLNVRTDQASCLGVGAALSSVPALGRTATLTVTVKAGRVEKATKVTVDLPTNLAFADGTATTAARTGAGPTARATVATVDLARGDIRTFTRTVKAVGTGAGEITARALSVVGPGRTDGGADQVHFTVGAGSTPSRAGIAPAAGNQATAATSAKVVSALPAGRASVALPSPAVPTQSKSAAAPGTTCATGSWVFVNQNGTTVGAYQTVVQIWRGSQLVAGGYAQGNGSYNLCWSSGGGVNSVYVRFVESNNAWKVVTNAGNDYAYVTGTQSLADGTTGNFGTLQPADGTQHRALHAYYDAAVMFDWIYQNAPGQNAGTGCWSPYASSCRTLVVHWQSDSTDGTYWNGEVHLLAASPDSEDEPVHEYGHDLMYGLYGNSFPATTNCSPHYLLTVSSATCGWTEGFADWVPMSVWGNTIYTFPSQSTLDFNRTWNDGYDTGDQVEGRIVQALDSLNDGVKYPFDNLSGPGYRSANANFTVLRTYKPNTFAGFWSGRGAAGQDVSQAALSALYQGTIDYGFRNPLTDGVAKSLPQAVPAHNYSFTTNRSYWSAVAVRPADGSDVDLTLYNDAGLSSSLGSSAYGGSSTDFVAINSNSGARPFQTYYPRVNQFTGTGGYTVEGVQGISTFSAGTTSVSTSSAAPITIMDSYQNAGVPVYYRAVPQNGQSVGLTFLQPGGTIANRSSGLNSAVGGSGDAVSLSATPSVTGYGGLVLVNQGMTSGTVALYADATAPTGGTVVINNGAARTTSLNVTLTLSASDAETGVANMQISTDGTFDSEPVVPYATTATATLFGQNGTKPVYVRYQNNAGMWSDPVLDRIKLQAAPAVSSLSKTSGATAGGTVISVVGNRFTGATQVLFGSTATTNFTVVNDIKINVTVPAGSAGAVHVRVTTPYGTSASSASDVYTYVAPPAITALSKATGTTAGGNTIYITGTGFTGATAVKFGTTAAASFTVVSATRIQVVTPAHAAGAVDVRVTAPGGTSPVVAADAFTFR